MKMYVRLFVVLFRVMGRVQAMGHAPATRDMWVRCAATVIPAISQPHKTKHT